jgi:hypothetical protein
MATIAGRFVERSAGLIPTPWAATIGIAFLVNSIFDVVPVAGELADAVGRRLGGARREVVGAALNQTSLAHSLPPLTNTDRYRYSSHTTPDRPGWVWIDGCRQRVPAQRSGDFGGAAWRVQAMSVCDIDRRRSDSGRDDQASK